VSLTRRSLDVARCDKEPWLMCSLASFLADGKAVVEDDELCFAGADPA
jgi:hypothetical protein